MATSNSSTSISGISAGSSSSTSGTTSGVCTTPGVIRHAYGSYTITGEKQTAKCNSCGFVISEKKGTTSSFTR